MGTSGPFHFFWEGDLLYLHEPHVYSHRLVAFILKEMINELQCKARGKKINSILTRYSLWSICIWVQSANFPAQTSHVLHESLNSCWYAMPNQLWPARVRISIIIYDITWLCVTSLGVYIYIRRSTCLLISRFWAQNLFCYKISSEYLVWYLAMFTQSTTTIWCDILMMT